ncbi:MAG: C69 family dipeptidase [Hornefia sp.]|nr:C69 family dipeptidase [Hornefia sp.]
MKRVKLVVAVLALVMAATTAGAFACTGMYVGRGVSKEGTTIIARSEDQGQGAYNKMFKVRPRIKKAGRFFRDSANGFKYPLPTETYKYSYVPDASDAGDGEYPATCTNEYGVAVVGTVSTEVTKAYEKVDPTIGGTLREATLAGIIAGQVKTARQAAELCCKLHDKYGSEEWNTLFFMDKKEAWVFENYGGHTYCAMKLPADKVAVFGNQCMIEWVDPADKSGDYIYSKGKWDLFKKIEEAGHPVKDGGKYHVAKSVAGTRREEYSNMRNWIGVKTLAPSNETVKDKDYSDETFYPFLYSPDKKVSVLEIMKLFRNRYEGTKYDMNLSENGNRRPIGTERSSDVHIIQNYKSLPTDSSNLQWLCMGNAEHSVFVPAFSGITDTHKAYKVDGTAYDSRSAYWTFKENATLAQAKRVKLSAGTKAFWSGKEAEEQKAMEKEFANIKKAYKKSLAAGRKYVTALGIKTAQEQLDNAIALNAALKYIATSNDKGSILDRQADFVKPVTLKEAAKEGGFALKELKVYKKKTFTKKVTKYKKVKKGKKYVKVKYVKKVKYTKKVVVPQDRPFFELKKGDQIFKLQLKSRQIFKNGEYVKDLVGYGMYKSGKTIYVPGDLTEQLKAIK